MVRLNISIKALYHSIRSFIRPSSQALQAQQMHHRCQTSSPTQTSGQLKSQLRRDGGGRLCLIALTPSLGPEGLRRPVEGEGSQVTPFLTIRLDGAVGGAVTEKAALPPLCELALCFPEAGMDLEPRARSGGQGSR